MNDELRSWINSWKPEDSAKDIETLLEEDNEKLRDSFFREHSFFTKHQVMEMNGTTDGLIELHYEGFEWYPVFQFDYSKIVQEVMKLNSDMSHWQVALWFDSDNGWLDGKTPMEQLKINPGKVLIAAIRISEPCIG